VTFKRIVNIAEILTLVGVAVFVFSLFANEPDLDQSSERPGGEIFATNCAGCHGADGSGGNVGVKLAGRVVEEFPEVEDQIAVVTDGRGGMPSFRADLSEEEIRQVVEYTRTDLGDG
jgi:cytochrome c oxidase subunit II